MEDKKHIKTPEGVARLLEDMWLRHKTGIQQSADNVFWVDLPPLTEEEKAEIEAEKKSQQSGSGE